MPTAYWGGIEDTAAVFLKCHKCSYFSPTASYYHKDAFLMGEWEGKIRKSTKAISAAPSLLDAQIKSLLIPHAVANQRSGLFYHQKMLSAQHAFRDLSLCCAGPAVTLHFPVSTCRHHQDDTHWLEDGVRQACVCIAHQDQSHRMAGVGREFWRSSGPKKNQVLVPAGSVFCWLPAAQVTQDSNRAIEIMAGQFAVVTWILLKA